MNPGNTNLRDVLLIHWHGVDQPLDWLRIDANGRIGGVLREQAPPASAIDSAGEIIVLAPSEAITLLSTQLPARQAEQARKAAPFAVEDQIAGNVENLHFSVAPNGPGHWWVAAIQPDILTAWLAALQSRGIHPDRLIPDVLALDALRDVSVVLIDGERALVRAPGSRAFAVEADLIDSVLATSAASGQDVQRFECGPGAPALHKLASGMRHTHGLNLLCAPFSAVHRGTDLRARWRRVLWVAAAALTLGLGFIALDQQRLDHRLQALNAEMEKVYRTQFPQAQQVPNPLAQMKSALAAAGGNSGIESAGLGLLAASAPVLSAQVRVQLEGAEYRSGALTLRLTAPSIEALDKLRESLGASGNVNATLENAEPGAEGVDGRIKLESRS
jgi:general secretion pathway protein L